MRQRYFSDKLSKANNPSRSSNVLTQPKRSHQPHPIRKSGKFSWLIRPLRLIYLKLLRLRGKPDVVAKGLAVGVFAGCFPFFGIQSLLGIALATIIRGSKVAAIAATWISNPLTYVPIFVFNYNIGKIILGTTDATLPPLDIESFTAFKELGATFATTLLTGSCVVGMILAVVTYFYSLAILERWHRNRLNKNKHQS